MVDDISVLTTQRSVGLALEDEDRPELPRQDAEAHHRPHLGDRRAALPLHGRRRRPLQQQTGAAPPAARVDICAGH